MKVPKLSTSEADEIKNFNEISSNKQFLYAAKGETIFNRRKLESFNVLKMVNRDKLAFNLSTTEQAVIDLKVTCEAIKLQEFSVYKSKIEANNIFMQED